MSSSPRLETIRVLPKAYASVINNASTIVTAFLWAEAIKSMFAPKGVFRMAAHYGPWMTAIFATCIALVLNKFFNETGLVKETPVPLKP